LNESKYGSSSDNTPTDIVRRLAITFDSNGGVVDETSRLMEIGSVIGDLPTATRESYSFDGWWTSPVDGIGIRVNDDSIVTDDFKTLYAHWLRVLKEIKISGIPTLISGKTSVYSCTATFEDGQIENIYPTWSASDGSIDANGRFAAPVVSANKVVDINASYEDNGVVKETQFQVNVIPEPEEIDSTTINEET
jgi:hypothetical protein